MPDANIVVMKDLRDALGSDAQLGTDLLGMHPVGIHRKDALYESRTVGDLVGDRDALLLQVPADGTSVAAELVGEFVDTGTGGVPLGNLPDFVV